MSVLVTQQRPGLGEALGGMASSGLTGAIDQFHQDVMQKREKQKRESEFEKFLSSEEGKQLTPQQKSILKGYNAGLFPESSLRMLLEKPETPQSLEADQKNFDIIKDAFGEKFANIWKASPTGARTALTQAALDAQLRGLKINELLGDTPSIPTKESISSISEKGELELPDYQLDTTGMKPNEIPTYKKELRKENAPRLQEAITKTRSLDKELDAINVLKSLNPKLPSGVGKLIIRGINPKTGEIFIPSITSPQVQRFVKTINDFTTKAKDSYGARVTNFDLQQFMARLPTLANSEEGRSGILRQMEISSQLDKLYEDNLKKVYQKYGAGNITFEDADAITSEFIKGLEQQLRSEYDQIDDDLEKLYHQDVNKEELGLTKVTPGTKLTNEKAKEILQTVNGDKEKARKIAKQLGYEF